MKYKELNKNQKERMKQISAHVYSMDWKNPEFMDCLMGALPRLRRFNNEDEIAEEIARLEKLLLSYNPFHTNKSSFLSKVRNEIEAIQKKKGYWYGINLNEIESSIKIHSCCLVSGEGGIGKSYFLKCFEEQLEENDVEHLCVYGKFEKDTSRIDVDEIIEASENGFVFIYDAINEMSEEGQRSLLKILALFRKQPQIRIVLSYRTNSMDEVILKELQKLSEYDYKFPGVSFESALDDMIKLSIPDVYLYEDILYSNNALLLSMLCDVLSSEKLIDEQENSIASVTYILERYIKITIDKTFKNDLTCKGLDIWRDTKRVAKWMYLNEKKQIDENSLLSIIQTGENFIPAMMQMEFMGVYEDDGVKWFYFAIDSLTDYLIARSLFKGISGKEYQEQVRIIKSKAESLYSIEEAFIIALFDHATPDYEYIKKLLKDTGLFSGLDYRTLVKVHFKRDDIKAFQETFRPLDHSNLLTIMGGFTDKPLNCSNYLFEYYCEKQERIIELSNVLSGYHFQNEITNRLKNVLYFITFNDREDRRDDEAFYFALLCCAAPNKDIRCLAMRLLYGVVSKNVEYIDRLINEYDRISDLYIQEAVIYVLSQLKQNYEVISKFFKRLINTQNDLTAKSIRRISAYFGEPYSYIMWDRKDLYQYNPNAVISDNLNDILSYVDLMNKDFLPFRYWGKNNINMFTEFLADDKHSIKEINDYLYNEYACVRDGECSGLIGFENKVLPEIRDMADIKTMDINSFMESFESVFKYTFTYYSLTIDKKAINMDEADFHNSVYMKCVDLAVGLYYGSMMCNHYTDNFATYNNSQDSIGYEVYDPLEYGEEVIITSPIPTYQDYIERLGDYVLSNLEQPLHKNINWAKDVELTRRNVLHLIEVIKVKKQEWVMLAGRISMHEEDKHETKWRDTYDIWCCTLDSETIRDDGNARYFTIELDDYIGELKSYPENETKPWLCKDIKDIASQSAVFEQTSLVLPPSEIIKYFNLKLNVSDISWENQDKEKVIICNNNNNSYYRDPIGGTVFIRKDYYDKYAKTHCIKYFAFTERYIPETGYADETSLHFEIREGKITKEIKNDGRRGDGEKTRNPMCDNCPHTNISEKEQDESLELDMVSLKEILKEYGAYDETDVVEELLD